MKITYNSNPFATTVELDDTDRKYLSLAIQLEAALSSINSYRVLDTTKDNQREYQRQHIERMNTIAFGTTSTDAELKEYEEALLDVHTGDCVQCPCTCRKCLAEQMLGIDTLQGLSDPAIAGYLFFCFVEAGRIVDRNVSEVFDFLNTPNQQKPDSWANYTQEEYEKHIPTFESHRLAALAWYTAYVTQHGFMK